MQGTFMMAQKDEDGRVEYPYLDSFDLLGETWLIHTYLGGTGYKVSHKETGYAVPNTYANDADTAKELAIAFLTKNQDKLASTLAKVRYEHP